MRMTRFRVQNFKKVRDTEWINCGNMTVFVGKNESGKSAIFRGLSKINPSDGEKYDGLREFPRRRFTNEFSKQDWIVSSVEFELGSDEKKELNKISSLFQEMKSVVCTRYYSQRLSIEFDPKIESSDISSRAFLGLLNELKKSVEKSVTSEEKAPKLTAVKTALLPFFSQTIQQTQTQNPDNPTPEATAIDIKNKIMAQTVEEWQKESFKEMTSQCDEFIERFVHNKQFEQGKQWIEKNMPKFIYFDRYDVIDSAIHVPTFIQSLNQNPTDRRLRATKCLFQHVGLDLQDLQRLDPTQTGKAEAELRRMADERSIKMSSASNAMTQKFSEWWEQRKHRFRYQVDGPSFRVWVSDDLDPSEIELDQRSAGMQYFFSFYLIFLVEAEAAHRNSILLLDEPGLHVHGTAQQKIVAFLDKLSQNNQLLYTTHSPFMIDGNHLERVRIVYEDSSDGTTRVSEDVWPKDKDSLFPLQAGLGYAIAQTLFFSKRQMVVEGLTDYSVLKAFNENLSKKGMKTLREDAVIVPSGGIRNLLPLASLLLGHEIKIAILLDGDEPGLRKREEIAKKFQLTCLCISDFAGKEKAEIEDLFAEDFYLKAVGEAYPNVTLKFTREEREIEGIAKRVETAFKRMNIPEFEKWRPLRLIVDWIQKDPEVVTEDVLARFENIFEQVNSILSE